MALLCFYNFSAEHWAHIWTTNPIEATFAMIPHRITKRRHYQEAMQIVRKHYGRVPSSGD